MQVELAQSEYQLPRLTRMWSHLERQAGGRVRGMGEKQIEVDKRLLRSRISALRRSIEVLPFLSPCTPASHLRNVSSLPVWTFKSPLFYLCMRHWAVWLVYLAWAMRLQQ